MEPNQQQQKLSNQLLGKFSYIWSILYKTYNLDSKQLSKMNSYLDDELVNNAIGSMFGAFIGDALGSYFMQMPGKGTFNIKPGQFTDDSQMTSHMLQGLSSYDPNLSFYEQKTKLIFKIAQQYVKWYKSNPFDIGNTTRNALSLLNHNLQDMKLDLQKGQEINYEKKLRFILTKIEIKNLKSGSNGSLMRITPMAFFISLLLQKQRKKNPKIEFKDFESFIKCEINLTHGNPQIHESSYAWVELLVDVINHKKNKKDLRQIYESFIDKYAKNETISHWIQESLKLQDMDAIQYLGKAIGCFSYGIKALKTLSEIKEENLNDDHYVTIIKRIISKAGDSDTNAAIVGGLVGAVLGFKRLPQNYLFKHFKLELNQNDLQCSKRGPFYEPKRQFYKAMKLVEKFYSPNK